MSDKQPETRKWRLLDRRDTIRFTDEYLSDDCETWTPLPNNKHVGDRYTGNLFMPMRRSILMLKKVKQP